MKRVGRTGKNVSNTCVVSSGPCYSDIATSPVLRSQVVMLMTVKIWDMRYLARLYVSCNFTNKQPSLFQSLDSAL
jgi:hypothetical protein